MLFNIFVYVNIHIVAGKHYILIFNFMVLDLELILYFIVKPSYQIFKADLKSALEHMICKKAESIIMVDELVQRINDRFPGAHGFERCNIPFHSSPFVARTLLKAV